MTANKVSDSIIGAAIEVHRQLGPGVLESAYQKCLCRELTLRGIPYVTEMVVPIEYKGVRIESGYRIDLLVCDLVIVEVKAVEKIDPIHEAQLLTYLRLTGKTVGLLINFNVAYLRNGIKRRVLNHDDN